MEAAKTGRAGGGEAGEGMLGWGQWCQQSASGAEGIASLGFCDGGEGGSLSRVKFIKKPRADSKKAAK